MKKKIYLMTILLIALSMVFSACQPAAAPEAPKVEKVLNVVNGPTDVNSLDPSILEDVQARQVANEIFGGLTFVNEVNSATEPNMATSWDVSEDGKVYTFHLRNDVPWVKFNQTTGKVEKTDKMVTANDFRTAILRTLDKATASAFAYVNAWYIAGADAYNKGEAAADTVAIKAVDDYTLEITFVQPAAFNAAVAGMSMNYAQPSWLIEKFGDQWTDPANIETFGPFAITQWVHDDSITLVKNPFWPGSEGVPQSKVDKVVMLFRDTSPSMSEYEAGNIDWVQVPSSEIDRVKADSKLSKEFTITSHACTYYYLLNTMSPFTDDVRVRKALSYSVDRQSLVDYVTKAGEIPARTDINPSLAGAPDLAKNPDLGPTFDLKFAQEQLKSYLDEKGLKAADVTITIGFNSSEFHQSIAEAIQQMWKDNLGITVNLQSIESKVYWAQLDTPDMPQVARMGWCPDYFDADNFIKGAFRTGAMNNEVDAEGKPSGGVRWSNPEFDKLVDEAAAEPDNAKRQELYAKAEKIISMDDVVFIPLYYYTFPQLTKPYITRTFSVSGVEAYEKWDVDMAAKTAK